MLIAKYLAVSVLHIASLTVIISSIASVPSEINLSVEPTGPPRVIYRWTSDRCENEFIPDAPARAFRRADGQIVLITTHRENWSLVGDNFQSLKSSCQSLLRSSAIKPNQGASMWIEATYTRDGRRVAALISEDLTQQVSQSGCLTTVAPGHCWLNEILAAESYDMGKTFSLLPKNKRTVATLGSIYPDSTIGRFGVFTTSNIVEHDGNYYIIAYAQGQSTQDSGNCLLQSTNPIDASLWRAWDGEKFSINLSTGIAQRSCHLLDSKKLPGEVRSLSYLRRRNVWIAVFAARLQQIGDKNPTSGFYYSQSKDLYNWSTPRRIIAMPTRSADGDQNFIAMYPSIIDPGSESRNFDSIDGDQPWLFFTVEHLKDGKGTMNRDLQWIPLGLH